jgi:PAS domain S-box-containing protein
MLGYEDHEIGDHLDAWIPHVHPDDVGRVLTLAHARLSDGQSHYEVEHRMIHKDGGVRWFIARGIVIRDGEGRASRVIGTHADNTERRRVRAEVEEQHRQLAHLARAAMLGELSGALAHELNQPLSAILANAAAAQRFLAQDPPNLTEVRDVLEDIVHDDNRAGAVIARLRSLLKKGERRLQRLDLNEIVSDVLVLVRSDLVERRVSVETKLAPGLPLVLGDRVQAQQVLLNLILNACDAMGDNAPRDRLLTILTAPGDSGVLLSVVDQGVGIPQAIMERIFEPFFTSKEHGMGLGLAICRSIMRTQGGRLWATNNPDRGATLWVEFGLETPDVADQFSAPIPFGDVALESGVYLPNDVGVAVPRYPARAD